MVLKHAFRFIEKGHHVLALKNREVVRLLKLILINIEIVLSIVDVDIVPIGVIYKVGEFLLNCHFVTASS